MQAAFIWKPFNTCTRPMLPIGKLHHVGYTVRDINASIRQFTLWGWEAGETLYDKDLNVELCYLTRKGEVTVELVHQLTPSSLEANLLHSVGVCPYHLGYETENMEQAVTQLSALGYEQLFSPTAVAALGGKRICYFSHLDMGYVELVEA